MTGCKSLLSDYQDERGPDVVFGDNNIGKTRGYGVLTNGNVMFKRVAYVEGLKHNLLSISQFCDAKNKVLFHHEAGVVYNKKGSAVLGAQRKGNTYIVNMDSAQSGTCFYSRTVSEEKWLWHKRLSHLNFKTISKLSKYELVNGLPKLSFDKDKLCSACEKGKHHSSSFKSKQTSSVTECFQLMHMDLFGPVSSPSFGGKRYCLVIVDEYSRYTWVFFLKAKGDATQEVISFIKKMENLNNCSVKHLRSDNGTEFRNNDLESFCDSKGISQNFSAPRTPQQNGVAERRNRTLIESARSMLIDAGLKTHFWAEAVNTACFTQNRSLIVKRHDKTAYEVLRGRKPDISFLHVFGSTCYVLNKRDHLGKFDPKADEGIFIGYSIISKAFRVYNKRRECIEESMDVTFDESYDESLTDPKDYENLIFNTISDDKHEIHI